MTTPPAPKGKAGPKSPLTPGDFVVCTDPIHGDRVIGRLGRQAEGGEWLVGWFAQGGLEMSHCFREADISKVEAPPPEPPESPAAKAEAEEEPAAAKHGHGHGKGKK